MAKKVTGMTVTITKDEGELTGEELQAVGRMIEDGYKQGYGNPYGLKWDTEIIEA